MAMTAVSTNDESSGRRRLPVQGRSRERVERILDATAALVVAGGVDALTTRAIAAKAGVPVASLYQYFSDKEGVLLALVGRDMAEMDEQVATDLAKLTTYSVGSIVETTMRAYVAVYHRRPAFMQIWLRGRTNAAVYDYGREHNRRTAAELWAFVDGLGIVREDASPAVAELAVEIGDRCFQLAFESSLRGDDFLIEEGIAMVTAYLERHATPEGIAGVPA
jgi:AcrR family transcriptional regulator